MSDRATAGGGARRAPTWPGGAAAVTVFMLVLAVLIVVQDVASLSQPFSGDPGSAGDSSSGAGGGGSSSPNPSASATDRSSLNGGGGQRPKGRPRVEADGSFTEVRGGKVVALTFDDGPGDATAEILDLLAEHDAVATFFMVGNKVEDDPAMVRAVVEAGHQVQGHSWTHADLRNLSQSKFDREVDETNALLEELTGAEVTCVRPPFGAVNNRVLNRLGERGLDTALWSTDTRDWQRPGADVIAERAIAGLSRGAVILFHDGGGDRSQTVAALDRILTEATEKGLKFVPACS